MSSTGADQEPSLGGSVVESVPHPPSRRLAEINTLNALLFIRFEHARNCRNDSTRRPAAVYGPRRFRPNFAQRVRRLLSKLVTGLSCLGEAEMLMEGLALVRGVPKQGSEIGS